MRISPDAIANHQGGDIMYLDPNTRRALGQDRIDEALRQADRARLCAAIAAERAETRRSWTILQRVRRTWGALAQARAQ
jgi:hypothetical protein